MQATVHIPSVLKIKTAKLAMGYQGLGTNGKWKIQIFLKFLKVTIMPIF